MRIKPIMPRFTVWLKHKKKRVKYRFKGINNESTDQC